MAVYIALLRGVNVGGKNRIQMAALRQVLESAGLGRVETYIQSGNLIFESEEAEDALRDKILSAILQNFGFSVPMVLRTAGELKRLIGACPFSAGEIAEAEAANSEGESFYVCLSAREFTEAELAAMERLKGGDDFRAAGRDLCFLLRRSIRNSPLAGYVQKLDGPCTIRNWKTPQKLAQLAGSRKG